MNIKDSFQKFLITVLLVIFALGLIAFLLFAFAGTDLLQAYRIVFGSVYVLFLPGFVLSYIFFPQTKSFNEENKKGAIDWIERIALSFALSIAVVPLAIFYLNLAGIKITLLNSFLTILAILAAALSFLYWRSRRNVIN